MGSETTFMGARDDHSVGNDGAQDVRDVVPEVTDDIQELRSGN
jgi:hypothetical protein